jgi:anti-sigma factor RsiW
MTTTDPFAYSDAAYVLGALDDADRRAYEVHLETCADCRRSVEELRSTAAMLAVLPRSGDADEPVPEPVPDTLLPGLLRRAEKERRRRRTLTGVIGAVAAACLVALAVVLWPGHSSTPQSPAPIAFSALQPNPLTVSARLTPRAWGTQIDLHCTYPAGDDHNFAYDLVVIDKSNHAHMAGDWSLVPGKAGINFTSGTSVPRDQITRMQIRTPTGTPLLQVTF